MFVTVKAVEWNLLFIWSHRVSVMKVYPMSFFRGSGRFWKAFSYFASKVAVVSGIHSG
jgi:hypothetical protein